MCVHSDMIRRFSQETATGLVSTVPSECAVTLVRPAYTALPVSGLHPLLFQGRINLLYYYRYLCLHNLPIVTIH